MKIPKTDSLTNPSLFSYDVTQLWKHKNQINSQNTKRFETKKTSEKKQFVEWKYTNISGTEKFVKTSQPIQEEKIENDKESHQKILNKEFESEQAKKGGGLTRVFYFQKLVTYWFNKFLIRPTASGVILGSFLYLVAIISTIQRREGDRYFSILLNAKMPGWGTQSQKSSWETFQLLNNLNPYSLSHKNISNNNDLGNTISPVSFADLYKDKAVIHLCSPWEKQIRKDFVGVFPLRSHIKYSEKERNSEKYEIINNKHILLPWYRIDACNQANRTIIPKSEEKETDTTRKSTKLVGRKGETFDAKTAALGTSPKSDLQKQREKNLLNFFENKKHFKLLDKNKQSQQMSSDGTSFRDADLIRDKIYGLEYLFSVYPSKERVYAENDSIPFKLESPYFTRDFLNSGSEIPDQKTETNLTLKTSYSSFSRSRLESEKEKSQLFAKNNKLFFGKHLYYFQRKLRNLFYLYGFPLPGNLTELVEKDFLESQVEKRFLDQTSTQVLDEMLTDQKEDNNLNDQVIKDISSSESHVNKISNNAEKESKEHNKNPNSLTNDLVELDQFVTKTFLLNDGEEKTFAGKKTVKFDWRNWPLLANASSLRDQEESNILNQFDKNDSISVRLMSGYKFPDLTRRERSELFKKFVFRKLLVSAGVTFSPSYLTNQVVLQPLYIQLPPFLPSCFFQNLAFSLFQKSPQQEIESKRETSTLETHTNSHKENFQKQLKDSDVYIDYKNISLQELKEVKDLFSEIGEDYKDYLNQPKGSPLAVRISASLEDDQAFELEAQNLEEKDDEKVTTFEHLRNLREKERKLENGKELRPFAYKNQLAFLWNTPVRVSKNKLWSSSSSGKAVESNNWNDNSWTQSRLGPKNMCSDRKYSFFGRKHLLTKRLVAQEQEEINNNILKESFCSPEFEKFFTQEELSKKVLSYKKLQRRARKNLIKLLGVPELSARNTVGSRNRTQKPNRALRGKVINSEYSHLRWQKKRFRSRILGTPCKRHLIMPEITASDWKKMLEWQLKNYFFLEKNRLQALKKEDIEKTFKARKLDLYLPWVTIRTASNRPFQWPLTRLDYAMGVDSSSSVDRKKTENLFKSNSSQTEDLKKVASQKMPPQERIQNYIEYVSRDKKYKLPVYKPVYYWDAGKSVSLSSNPKHFASSRKKAGAKRAWSFHLRESQHQNGIRVRTSKQAFLCEPLTNQSWLFLYRLFLAFALKHLLKYIYRVSLKDFLSAMVYSDVGLMMTSPEFRDWLEGNTSKLFYTPRKRLQDIAALEENIPTLSEIVWYLRNYGRGRAASSGLLLVGQKNTEKTSVVQAIAGECNLPVIVQSMSALALTHDDPYERLENVFTLARQKAPCVLFLDDLDVIGQSRTDVTSNHVGSENLLFALDTYTAEGKLCLAKWSESLHTDRLPKPGYKEGMGRYSNWDFNPLTSNPLDQPNLEFAREQRKEEEKTTRRNVSQKFATSQENQESQSRRLNLLLRLLTLMDGVAPLNGVLIVGTSEQPAFLDPALLRAGRFERRIRLSLPNKERRIQLFKLETQKIGRMQSMPWDYFGTRTANMSGADIVSAVNHSAIRAILDNTVHTVESLEHGLNYVTGSPNKALSKLSLQHNDPFHLSRLAFYQAGKAVVHSLLLEHPVLGFCSLGQAAANANNITHITRKNLQILKSDHIPAKNISAEHESLQNSTRNSTVSPKSFSSDKRALYRPISFQKKKKKSIFKKRVLLKTNPPGLNTNLSEKAFKASSFDLNLSKLKRQFSDILSDTKDKNSFTSIPSSQTVQTAQTETYFFARTRIEFETRLVGLYAGKAAELLHISSNSCDESSYHLRNNRRLASLWQSNLGFSELFTASSLIHLMVDRWYLYSQRVFTYKINKVIPSLNHEQIQDETLFPLAKRFSQELEFDALKSTFWGINAQTDRKILQTQGSQANQDPSSTNKQSNQERMTTSLWQAKICQALERGERPYGKWYRIYLPKVEEREQNEEWVPPDFFIHQSLTLSNLSTKTSPEDKSNIHLDKRTFSSSSGNIPWVQKCLTHQHKQRAFHPYDGKAFFTNACPPLKSGTPNDATSPLRRALSTGSRTGSRFRFLKLSLNKGVGTVQHVPPLKTFNDLYRFERDSAYHNAIMNCFYEAFNLLGENRELLDLFADHLIRFNILRSYEIEKICSRFSSFPNSIGL